MIPSTMQVTSLFYCCVNYYPLYHTGLPLNETTIAEMLRAVGYATAMVGKWHLGVAENFTYLPTNQGFEYYMVSDKINP